MGERRTKSAGAEEQCLIRIIRLRISFHQDLATFVVTLSCAALIAKNLETCNFLPQVHVEVSSEEYVVFGVVLFLWELVPTTFVVLFFRAQRLTQNLVGRGELLRLNTSCLGSRPLGRLSEISLLAFFFFSCHRLQQEWSIVTVTAPEPTSSTIQGATTAMTTCRGLGPEKEGKCCAGRVEKAPSWFYWVKVIRSGYHAGR